MKVLLAGNTGYVTEEFVEEAFPECQVMVLGNKMLKTARRRELISRPFPRTELELGDIFRTYEFEAVVYFSNYLTLHGELEGEAENLRKLLQYCRKGVQSHFLYVTGPEGMYDVPTGKTLLVQNAEDVCRRYAGLYGLKVKILRVPYLYSGTYKKDFFYRIFQASKESQKLFFQEAPEQKACFLYSMDLAELVYKLFDNWNDEEEVLNVPDVFDICFQDVTEELKKVLSPVSIIYKSSAFTGTHTSLSRLCGYWLIWENLNEYLATTLDVTCHGNTSCLDLVGLNPTRLGSNNTVLTIGDRSSSVSLTSHRTAELLTTLNSLWH